MHLKEVFDRPYPYTWSKDDEMWIARFRTEEGYAYQIDISLYGPDAWEIAFSGGIGNTIKATGTGDEFKVFATVVAAIKEWATEMVKRGQKPREIEFSADKNTKGDDAPRRAKLYRRFANQLAKGLGLVVTTQDGSDSFYFILRRPKLIKRKVTEAFDRPYTYKWMEKSDEMWKAVAETPAGDLIINFTATDFESKDWEINFQRGSTQRGDYKATGAGDEFRAFATVIAAIREWFKARDPKPEEIMFSGDKADTKNAESRIRLYDRFAKQFAKQTGYDVNRLEHKMSVSWYFGRPDLMVQEVKIDNREGRGAVPNNMEVDYFGMRVQMRPSTFIKLAAPLGRDASDEMKQYIAKGGAIGAPFLIINVDGDEVEVVGHEGRNRMIAVKAMEGDAPIETHLFFRGDISRARHLTPEIVDRLRQGMRQENTGKQVAGPLWEGHWIVAEEKTVEEPERHTFVVPRKFTDIMLVFIKEPHMNPNIDRMVYYVKAFNLDHQGRPDGPNHDGRYNREFDDEKKWRNAMRRVAKQAIKEDGRIVKGVNTTVDVKPGETQRQAKKFGNKLDKKGQPPLLNAKARKRSDPHTLSNLGLTESFAIDPARWNDNLAAWLETIQDKMEDVNSASMDFDTDDPQSKKLEKDYQALAAIETVILNHQKAIRSQNPKHHFLYSMGDDKYTALHIFIDGDEAEIKWIGSYNNSGKASELMNNAKELLKKNGVKRVSLTAKWGSEGFYERLNFKRDSETRHDPLAGTTFTDMSKDINEQQVKENEDAIDTDTFARSLAQKYNLKDIWINDHASRNAIELASIIVPRDQLGQGTGTKVMDEIVDFAEENGRIIVLDPAIIDRKHGTTSQSRLRKFYKRFGFVDNKGRNKNYEFRQLMIRYPKNKIAETLKKVKGKWALVSKTNPKKVLQYYDGPKGQRPSKEWVKKVERRVHAFEAIVKPDPKDTLGVDRADMPQVAEPHYPELMNYLESHGVTRQTGKIDARKLKAVQHEFSDEGVEKMMSKKAGDSGTTREKPLLVSRDNYIIDGHHRWLAAYNLGETIPIIRFSASVKELLDLVRKFPHTTYKNIYNESFNNMTPLQRACIEGGHDLRDLQENISIIGTERGQEERKKNLKPGTDAWFKHWFSRPKLTREDVDFLKSQIKGVRNEKANRHRKANRD